MEVEAREIPEWPGYRVSSSGVVESGWTGKGENRKRIGEWITLKQSRHNDGHLVVGLFCCGRKRQCPVHQLVLIAFVGPRVPGMVGRHLNDNKDDNRLANLAWGTPADNVADRCRNGKTSRGSRHYASKFTISSLLAATKMRESGSTWQEIGDRFGVTKSNARKAVLGIHWSALG